MSDSLHEAGRQHGAAGGRKVEPHEVGSYDAAQKINAGVAVSQSGNNNNSGNNQ